MSTIRSSLKLFVVAGASAALVAGAALTLAGCSAAGATKSLVVPAPARQKVRTAAVTEQAVAPPIRATGVLIAREQATLSFKVGGVVERIYVQPGDAVRPGQMLAKLDTREIDAQVRQAEVALDKARRDQARVTSLFNVQATTKQASDDAESALRAAAENVEIARFNRDHAVIVAQGSGRVARRLVEPNAVVAAGTPVVQLNLSSSGYVVRAGLIDRDIVRVALREKADVRFDAFPDRRFAGTVIELAEEPSPLSGVYDVQIRLDDPPPRLVSGLVAKVELTAPAAERLAVVPMESLVEGDGRAASVFTVGRDGRAHRRHVETAFILDRVVAVRAGLEGVDRVVTEGAAFLSDGALTQDVTNSDGVR
jgi:RND family efflux transporter MFP subunit